MFNHNTHARARAHIGGRKGENTGLRSYYTHLHVPFHKNKQAALPHHWSSQIPSPEDQCAPHVRRNIQPKGNCHRAQEASAFRWFAPSFKYCLVLHAVGSTFNIYHLTCQQEKEPYKTKAPRVTCERIFSLKKTAPQTSLVTIQGSLWTQGRLEFSWCLFLSQGAQGWQK